MCRRIEFTLTLKCTDESLGEMFGSLSDQLSAMQGAATDVAGKSGRGSERVVLMMVGSWINGQANAPAFRLTLAGADVTQKIEQRLISLTLTDNRGFEADQLDIELDDADG